MAYEIPTADQLQAKYPAFAAVADATVDVHIADAAANGVDDSWREADYAPAILALAAHNMALLNIGDHGEAAGYARAGVRSIRSGSFQADFSDKVVADAASGTFGATPYGRQYAVLLRRNKGGPLLIGGGTSPGDGFGPLAQQNDGGILPWAG